MDLLAEKGWGAARKKWPSKYKGLDRFFVEESFWPKVIESGREWNRTRKLLAFRGTAGKYRRSGVWEGNVVESELDDLHKAA